MTRTDLPEEDLRKLRNIEGASDRGSALTPVAGVLPGKPTNLQVLAPVEVLQRFCVFFSNYKKPSVQLRYPNYATVPRIVADANQVEQICRTRHQRPGRHARRRPPLEFDLRAEPHPGDGVDGTVGDYVCFIVRDTGNGIPADIRHRIFEPLFTTKPPGKGNRARPQRRVRHCQAPRGLHRSGFQAGRRDRVPVYFPVVGEMEIPGEIDLRILSHGKYTVLVVEDEETLGDLLCEMLELGIPSISPRTWPRRDRFWTASLRRSTSS